MSGSSIRGGDAAYGDSVVLTDTLRDGVVENLLLVLAGRRPARRRRGPSARTAIPPSTAPLTRPARWSSEKGCPKNPTWQINAVKVVHDPVKNRIRYEGACLNLLGAPDHRPARPLASGRQRGRRQRPARARHQGQPSNGFELSAPYYLKLAPNRDATITPHVYTEVLPMLEGRYRQLTGLGAFQLGGYRHLRLAHPDRPRRSPPLARDEGVRAYLEGNGRFQLDPLWSVTALGPLRHRPHLPAPLRHFARRPAALVRSTPSGSRADSYISIAGWAFQGLRVTDVAGQQPIALPAIDARWRFADPIWDGRVELQANSLAILRTDGQDTQRAFAGARWDRRSITRLGQELILTAYAPRRRLPQPPTTLLTDTLIYRGEAGWQRPRRSARSPPSCAGRWSAPFMGGTQRLTPRAPARRLAADPTISTSRTRTRARSTSRIRTCSRSTASPATTAGRTATRVTYGARLGASTCPASRSAPRSARATASTTSRASCPPGTGLSDRFSDYRRPDQRQVRPQAQPRPPLPARQGQSRDPPQRGRRRRRRPPDLCDDRLSAARPRHRPGDRGSARPRGDPARRPGQVRRLLVDLRLDRHRPHRPPTRTRSRSPTATSRSATGSASPMTTIASSLA